MIFFEGLLIGLSTIIFIGPVFFFLLSNTIESGLAHGVIIATGIIVSDVLYAFICKYGISSTIEPYVNSDLNISIGGILLIGIGLTYLFKKTSNITSVTSNTVDYLQVFVKGFLINFVNPFVFMVWIGIVQYSTKYGENGSMIYILGVLAGIFSIDLLKVVLAKKIRAYLNPNIMSKLYKLTGIILIFFGIRIFVLLL